MLISAFLFYNGAMTPDHREEVERKHFPERFGICDICEASVRIVGHEHDLAKLEVYLAPQPSAHFLAYKRQILYDLALALYTNDYLDRHPFNESEEEEATDPVYIKGRFDAHAGTASYRRYFKMAEAALNVCDKNADYFMPIAE